MSGLIAEVDNLYERCVLDSQRCSEQFFVDWSEGVAAGHEVDRASAKYIRRCLTAGRKLAAFWAASDAPRRPADWRAGVDLAIGARAWRPQLELAEHLLETSPSEAAFDAVSALFPLVHNEPFLDGIDYGEWSERR